MKIPSDLQTATLPSRRIRIRPSFQALLNPDGNFQVYTNFMESIIEKSLPEEIRVAFEQAHDEPALRSVLLQLNEKLPVLHLENPETTPGLIFITAFCSAEFTQGMGRFFNDIMSRWLIPGKAQTIYCAPSMNFRFIDYPEWGYFIQQIVIEVGNDHDLLLIKNNFPRLAEEARLTILAVKHARSVITYSHLTIEQKSSVIQDNIKSLMARPLKEFDSSIFDQMHQFVMKVYSERKMNELSEILRPLIHQAPNVFEIDVFKEVQHFVLLFREKFTAIRTLRHTSRLIAFQYLFRKILKNETLLKPEERHIVVKILPTKLHLQKGFKSVLGVVIGMSVLRDNEIFEQKHALEALQHILPQAICVKDSYVADRQELDKIRLFYVEFEKGSGLPFTAAEIKDLKKRLPRELKAGVESAAHPVFMPRNEEEVMRNIVLLSKELKYVRDIPQVIISFDSQSESHLNFTVILVRILQSQDISLEDILEHSKLSFQAFDVKPVGKLRNKYQKEANVFTAKVDKAPYLRKDFSVDLFKARQAVSSELARLFGDIRDFNGGILSKQHQLYHELRESLITSEQNNDYLLENFFYSISPPIMQSILPSPILKNLYLMMVEALEEEFKKNIFFLKTHWDPEYLLLMTASPKNTFKKIVNEALAELKIPSSDLMVSFVRVYEISCLGYIYRCEDPKKCVLFYQTVQKAMQSWEEKTDE
jgi:hypothetical protein